MITCCLELLAALLYLCLWMKQRSMKNLSMINKIDNTSGCFFICIRILIPVPLGIFILSRVHKIETPNVLSNVARDDD